MLHVSPFHLDPIQESRLILPKITEVITVFEIAIYERDRAYGGSEEGGWWYDTGERMRVLKRKFTDEEHARAACRRVNGWLACMRPSWVRSSGSMAYDGGEYGARVYPVGESPEHYPQSRPYYE